MDKSHTQWAMRKPNNVDTCGNYDFSVQMLTSANTAPILSK